MSVILCTVRPSDGCEALVTPKSLEALFECCGPVKNVRIFEQRVLVKAFIEFESQDYAEAALVQNEQKCWLGLVRVYPSNKPAILPPASGLLSYEGAPGYLSNLGNSFGLISAASTSSISEGPPRSHNPGYLACPLEVSKIQASFPTPSVEFQRSDPAYRWQPLTAPSANNRFYESVAPHPEPSETDLRVVMVNRVATSTLSSDHLLRLFGCYGRVKKILLNAERSYALLEFQTAQQAHSAVESLKTVRVLGCLLKAKISKYPNLSFRTLEKDANQQLQYSYVDNAKLPNKWAMTPRHSAPTPCLRVYNCPQYLTPLLVRELASEVHPPVEVIVIGRAEDQTQTMLLRFAKIEMAVDVLVTFDGQRVDDQRLCFVFSAGS